jgi:hypothetical protein
VVVTLERISEFHWVRAAEITGERDQPGSSVARYWQALVEEMKEIPILDFRVVAFEGNVKRPPIRRA